jgi:hypothetical protein
MTCRALAFGLVVVAGCADTLDDRVTERYWESPQWNGFATWGETPGHGDSYRVIYYNWPTWRFVGRSFEPGALIVKEVYDNAGERPGALRVIEIMRRTDENLEVDELYDRRMGWVFSATSSRGGQETDGSDFCWRRCHVNAPVAGAWFDYHALPPPPEPEP